MARPTNTTDKDIVRDVQNKIKDKIAVRLKDSFGTIIYIDKGQDKEKAIKKYLKDLEEYQFANNYSQGNSNKYKEQNKHTQFNKPL